MAIEDYIKTSITLKKSTHKLLSKLCDIGETKMSAYIEDVLMEHFKTIKTVVNTNKEFRENLLKEITEANFNAKPQPSQLLEAKKQKEVHY